MSHAHERTSLIYDEHRRKASPYGAVSNTGIRPNDTGINVNVNVNSTQTTQRTKPPRIVALDVFRGFLMFLQALDHARVILADSESQQQHETWYEQPVYKDWVPSLARLVTHLAAPGFAFMMGFGIILFSKSRLRIGWSINKLLKHYIIRSLVLILLNSYFAIFFMDRFAYVTSVLFPLGVNYIIGGLIFLAGSKSYPHFVNLYQKYSYSNSEKKSKYTRNIILLIIIILLAVGNILQVPKPKEYGKDFGYWRYTWLLPGEYKLLLSLYPPLNWLSFTIYGILYGHLTSKQAYNKRFNRNINIKIGVFLLTFFLAIRIPGKFGNVNPELLPPPPPGTLFNNPYLTSPLQFINAIKYPPDLSFTTLCMGICHLILACLYSIPSFTSYSILNYFIDFINNGPLLAFGQSALFFYMLHFHVYLILGEILKYLFGDLYPIKSWQFWFWWIFGLALLWPMCVKYGKFKSSKGPDSLWRFF